MKMQQQQAALIKHGFIYKRTNKGTGLYCAEALDKAGGVSHGFSTLSLIHISEPTRPY